MASVLFHVASTNEKPWHTHCPDGANSWCCFKKDEALGTTNFIHGKGLSLDVIKHIKPIFEDLSRDSLLTKCLHGKTQNQNESFNSTIWTRVPKDTFIGEKTFGLGVMDSLPILMMEMLPLLMSLMKSIFFVVIISQLVVVAKHTERCTNSIRKNSEVYRCHRKIFGRIDLFTDSDAIFEMSIWRCIMVYSGYMKSKQTRYRTT